MRVGRKLKAALFLLVDHRSKTSFLGMYWKKAQDRQIEQNLEELQELENEDENYSG